MTMNVLVTGGAGFIGSHVTEALLDRGDRVLVIDNYATSRRDTLAEPRDGLEIVEGSIADAAVVKDAFERIRPEIVVHCAASYKDPDAWEEDARTNVLGTINVARAAERWNTKRVVYFQTSLCYGNYPKEQPVSLNHRLEPVTSYAISKTAAEHYLGESSVELVSFRLANIFGPRNLSGPIPTFYRRLSEDKACFTVDTRRDFIFVSDLLGAVMPAIDGEGAPGFYHIASGADRSIKEIYEAVCKAMGIHRPCEERERGDDDAPTILLDPSRTEQAFGWKPKVSLEQGIEAAVEWYESHGVDQTFTHLKMKD